MRSLQNYVDIYRLIASNANLQGDSVEVLIQLLAQASYISEVENASYVQEASLEKAKLMNSKIQRCMDEMYSVFRGTCPRVILSVKPKAYLSFNVFDEIVSSNSFKIYYLGIYDPSLDNKVESEEGYKRVAITNGFKYGAATLDPSDDTSYILIGLLASETSGRVWQATKSKNFYFENLDENLSNDMWVTMNGELVDTTNLFSEHIMKSRIYDLTLPSFGSRLYVANTANEGGLAENTIITAQYYKYSTLSDYPKAELKKINIRGTSYVPFDDDFLNVIGYDKDSDSNIVDVPGLILLDSENRDLVETIHYKASRDRYVNSILRSNSDLGALLENLFPDKVAEGGTNYVFNEEGTEEDHLSIYYAPKNLDNLLTEEEVDEYLKSAAFYINNEIEVSRGEAYTAVFNIDVILYQAVSNDKDIEEILKTYENRFGLKLNEKEEEIKASISKISNIKSIRDFSIVYLNENGDTVNPYEDDAKINLAKVYFKIGANISSSLQTTIV